ncbi:MAG TPA: site-2 protease family protein [Tepidisphaeraceae bacterium]|nr:site-2 protease family protein [Tepidisphaeraceae bacterium]
MLSQLPMLLLLIFGFGFVIFFHELGHFLAAKWVGIRVEQFAVGFGQAILSWRKGMGVQVGSSGRRYEELAQRGEARDLGETEYRLNWIPLGGYVKMLGQDDLNPNAQQEDPRAYNKKSIGARMIVVSAGVIMNIFLAAVGFMAVFLMGFRTAPPVVGSVMPGSPAAKVTRLDGTTPAPLQVGDKLLMFDEKWQHSFDKIQLNVALSGEGQIPIYVERFDGTGERLLIRPELSEPRMSDFLMVGVGPIAELRGLDPKKLDESDVPNSDQATRFIDAEYRAVRPGETITAINGQAVSVTDYENPTPEKRQAMVKDYVRFEQILQESNGAPVQLTVADPQGKTEQRVIHPSFAQPFDSVINFGGMVPRAVVSQIKPNSSALDKLKPGDVIVKLSFPESGGDAVYDPTVAGVRERLEKAGRTGQAVDFVVIRDGKDVEVKGLKPNVNLGKGVYGLNIGLGVDEQNAVVGGTLENSPAATSGIPAGGKITALNGQAVKSWFDVKRLLGAASPDQPVSVAVQTNNGPKQYDLKLAREQIDAIAGYRFAHPLALREHVEPRQTDNPITAAAWGVGETRDFILQFYLTLHRMFQGRVSYKNMMGPVGIFNAGRHFAFKGLDWLIWFLAMISANLAVVNFLPIPIVDGGLFTFLIVEKLQGRPLSAKTQSIAQFVGLAIILSVFLLVTYQDIARLAG